MPFCFPDGANCVNFNQLGLACDERWDEARKLLTEGIWQSFFSALGRLDLATAAKQAATQPDLDVGLSQFLEKFPTDPDVLRPPKLALSATEQDLGTLAPGKDRTFPLQIANQGLLVLRGMVMSNCEWLSIGEPAGQPAVRMFQTRANHTLTVKVLGHKLRAGRKPLEGTLVVDTNGGNTTVVVRAHVPVRPFPKGANGNNVLAGAMSPHELAVKARAHPLEAATLFEQGAVRAWYASNGWTYPIQGTEGTGKGAVQQFFEALGLTKAPRLEISAQQISCKGKAGQRLTRQITISTQESRPVFANAWSNQDWIKPGIGKPQGNKITIPMQIEVPPRPGETLHASVTFQGNGNQQFVVPVTLSIPAVAPVEEQEEEPATSGGLRIGWLVAAITVMILITAGVIGFMVSSHEKAAGPPVAKIVDPPPPKPNSPSQPKNSETWWDKIPGTGLTASLAALKELAPQEKDLLDGIAAVSDVERYKAYQGLTTKVPELVRNLKARDPLGRLIADCCVFEPSELNVSPLLPALTSQIPRDRAEFRAEDQGDELKRGIWSLKVAFSALTNPAIRPERAKSLANQLGKVFGFALDTKAPPDELKPAADKLLAMRCYRNTLPTAAKSFEHALAMRASLLQEFPEHLLPTAREKVDVGLVAIGLSKNSDAFPTLEPILKPCLESSDLTTLLKIADLFEQAKPDLAPKLEGLFAGKWKALANPKLLTHADKVAALRKIVTGAADGPKLSPAERLAQLQKLTKSALATVKAASRKDAALLKDTLRLSHAATMACALFNKEAGLERFDELVARVPEIDPPADAEKKTAEEKPKTDKAKPPAAKGGVVVGNQPKVYTGRLTPASRRDTARGGWCDVYSFNLQAGQLYTIDHMSRDFDAYLRLEDPRGLRLAEDDDSGGGLNSRIVFQAPMNGNYRVIATSLGGRGTGYYTLIIRLGAGIPFRPGRPVIIGGRRIPGLPLPGLPLPGLPGEMPDEAEPKAKDKTETQWSQSDVDGLDSKQRSVRVTALENLAANVADDVAPRHARKLAKYLLSIQDKEGELEEVTAKLDSFAKCRQLLLALADDAGKSDVQQKTAEAVVGGVSGQVLQFARDEDWRTACRRLLVQRALDLARPAATGAAEQAAEILRDLYKEQGYAFGMDDKELAPLNRPAQVLAAVVKHVAAKASKHDPAAEDKEYLEQIGRYLWAAEFVADNDLEQLVVLQRVWLKVLSIYLQREAPAHVKRMVDIQQDLVSHDRRSASVLDQLRAGEERSLRIWALIHNLK